MILHFNMSFCFLIFDILFLVRRLLGLNENFFAKNKMLVRNTT